MCALEFVDAACKVRMEKSLIVLHEIVVVAVIVIIIVVVLISGVTGKTSECKSSHRRMC